MPRDTTTERGGSFDPDRHCHANGTGAPLHQGRRTGAHLWEIEGLAGRDWIGFRSVQARIAHGTLQRTQHAEQKGTEIRFKTWVTLGLSTGVSCGQEGGQETIEMRVCDQPPSPFRFHWRYTHQ